MCLSCSDVRATLVDVFLRHRDTVVVIATRADEKQRRQHHADFDRDGQVGEDRQRERREPDGDVSLSSGAARRGISPHSPIF